MSTPPPILEFDPDPVGVFDPDGPDAVRPVPTRAVACHFADLVREAANDGETVMPLPSGVPLVRLHHEQGSIGLFYPGQGAPLAAASLERVIAAGCSVVVGCGDAGALTGQPLGDLVVVDSAVRDEGTSYHYLPPDREVPCPPATVAALVEVAGHHDWDCTVGTTWTTDGLFRQTRGMIERRRSEGCVVVEMEAAAMLAVATFRSIRFGQYLVVGDDVSGPTWQDRGRLEADEVRRRALALSFDAAARLARNDEPNDAGSPASDPTGGARSTDEP